MNSLLNLKKFDHLVEEILEVCPTAHTYDNVVDFCLNNYMEELTINYLLNKVKKGENIDELFDIEHVMTLVVMMLNSRKMGDNDDLLDSIDYIERYLTQEVTAIIQEKVYKAVEFALEQEMLSRDALAWEEFNDKKRIREAS